MNWLALSFLFFIGVILPRGAWRSRRMLTSGSFTPPRERIYASAAFVVVLVGVLAICTAHYSGIELFPRHQPNARDLVVGIAGLGALLLAFIWRRLGLTDKMTTAMAPRNAKEKWMVTGVVLLAAFFEEISYRGVTYGIVAYWSESVSLGVIAAAIFFALAHLTQGPRAAGLVFVFALISQTMVLLSGTLYVAMVVHFAYDMIIAYVHGKRAAAEEAAAPVVVSA